MSVSDAVPLAEVDTGAMVLSPARMRSTFAAAVRALDAQNDSARGEFEPKADYLARSRLRIPPGSKFYAIRQTLDGHFCTMSSSFEYNMDRERMHAYTTLTQDGMVEAGCSARLDRDTSTTGEKLPGMIEYVGFRPARGRFARVDEYSWPTSLDSAKMIKPHLTSLFVFQPALPAHGPFDSVGVTQLSGDNLWAGHTNLVRQMQSVQYLAIWAYDSVSGRVYHKVRLLGR